MNDKIDIAFRELKSFIEKSEFKGYDPYDTLSTKLPLTKLGKWPSAIAIQIQKRNPINIRPLLGIKKEINPKAFGLFLHGYSILHQINPSEDTKNKMKYFFDWLCENYTKGYSGYCWGYNFEWASPVKVLEAYSPTIVVSGFIAKGIFEYYQATQDPKAIAVLESIGQFAWKDLERSHDETGICVSYSLAKKDCCYNASMLAAELFAMLYFATQKEEYRSRAIDISSFVIARQHDDGHWNYSIDPDTNEERTQIDFHQGYVLDSLFFVKKHLNLNDERFESSIQKGAAYYYSKQFEFNGQSLWRIPKKWPVDIHNQSQGIITFCRLQEYSDKYLQFAETIANWTINNMFDKKGWFYHRNYKTHKIKIPYIRWSQAWMFLALAELIRAKNGK